LENLITLLLDEVGIFASIISAGDVKEPRPGKREVEIQRPYAIRRKLTYIEREFL
jgi:hypothetical protein